MKKRGFTLIELLVVVAIIGIIGAIGITAVGDARVRARDAKKLADISQIRAALEMYYSDIGHYPIITGHNMMINGLCLTSDEGFVSCPGNGTRYIVVPPGVYNGYRYINIESGNKYEIQFELEKEAAGYPAGLRTADPTGIR